MTQKPLMIPFDKIRELKAAWFHAGKVGIGKIATKIIWENNGVLLSSGFYFGTSSETEKLVQKINKNIQ